MLATLFAEFGPDYCSAHTPKIQKNKIEHTKGLSHLAREGTRNSTRHPASVRTSDTRTLEPVRLCGPPEAPDDVDRSKGWVSLLQISA